MVLSLPDGTDHIVGPVQARSCVNTRLYNPDFADPRLQCEVSLVHGINWRVMATWKMELMRMAGQVMLHQPDLRCQGLTSV